VNVPCGFRINQPAVSLSASVAVILLRVSWNGMVDIVNVFCLKSKQIAIFMKFLNFESEKLRQISLCGFF